MAKYNEEFFRCPEPECGSAYFKFENQYVVAKDVSFKYPTSESRVLNKKTILVCAECGKKYTREELLENE